MPTTVVGMFDDRSTAEHAVQDLVNSGFNRSQISVVAADPEGKLYQQHVDHTGNLSGEGAATGLTSGAVVGGLLGLLIGAGLIFVPGGVIAAGPIAGLIAGGAAGAAAGGILGGLIGLGIPEDEADVYAESVRRGGTLVTVQADDTMADTAHRILDRDGAVNVDERAAAYRSEGFTQYDPNAKVLSDEEQQAERTRYLATPTQPDLSANSLATGDTATPPVTQDLREGDKLEVIREDLAVGKREVERGGVRVRSYVTERPVTEQVDLREEHVNIERRPVDRPADPNQIAAFKGGTIELREHAEVPVVAKEARVVEEIGLNKTVEQRTEQVRDTVRETHVEVEQLAGASAGFDDNYFQSDFNTRYGTAGGNYDTYRPAYQYGYQMASDDRYRGQDFASVENDLRTDYERRNPGQYATHRNAIQSAWDRAKSVVGGGAYADRPAGQTPTGVPNSTPGIQTGGHASDGTPDTRGITEKIADTVTGDRYDDKTGKRID